VIPRNSTTRPAGVEVRRRVEEQEEDQDHRKDPGFARPITLATTSSFGVGALCEYFARILFAWLGRGGLEAGRGRVDGSSKDGGDVRAALDQGEFAGPAYADAWDLAPLAASSRGGVVSCGGMRREPDVRQELLRAVLRKFYRSGEQI
jgi:hypothetical protein